MSFCLQTEEVAHEPSRPPAVHYRADYAGIFNQVAERGTSKQARSSGCARVPAHLASQRRESIPGSHAVATLVLATIIQMRNHSRGGTT
jgi:hypothetical protein